MEFNQQHEIMQRLRSAAGHLNAVIVILIVWAVKRFTSGSVSSAGQTPREIAQARYARGEITRDQYQQILQSAA